MLRVISWNVNRRVDAWPVLADLAEEHQAQVALVQEAVPPPGGAAVEIEPPADQPSRWHIPVPSSARGYASAVALLDPSCAFVPRPAVPLSIARYGQDELVATHPGQFAVADVGGPAGGEVTLVSLYGVWERMDSTGWLFAEPTLHRAISDLTPLLQHPDTERVIVAGDLNLWRDYHDHVGAAWQERFDSVFDRFGVYGVEVVGPNPPPGRGSLPGCPCGPTPGCRHVATYRNRGRANAAPYHNDWVLVSQALAPMVTRCVSIATDHTWAVSDHAPLLLELDIEPCHPSDG